jgi:pilus assembly protein CpaE
MANRILVVDDELVNLKITSATLKQAGYEILTAQGGREALQKVEQLRPDLLVLDLMMPDMNGYDVCRTLRSKPAFTHLPILMLTSADTLEEKVKGFEVGIDDYLVKPFQPVELEVRVKSLIRRGAAPPPVVVFRPTSKVIAGFSLRGGVGVSTIAINLAVSLAEIWQLPTALLDLTLVCGQDAVMLNLPMRNTWADLSNSVPAEIDADMVDRALLTHPSGLRVLAAPRSPEQAEKVTADHVSRVIALLKERYHYLVLDLPHNFQGTTLSGLDAADQILAVLVPELASVYATARTLDVFGNLEYSQDNFFLILNQIFQQRGLARSDIETALKHRIDLILPFASDTLIAAINHGTPLVTKTPENSLSVLLEDLAFNLSKEEHKVLRPQTPNPAWKRVAQRRQQRLKK